MGFFLQRCFFFFFFFFNSPIVVVVESFWKTLLINLSIFFFRYFPFLFSLFSFLFSLFSFFSFFFSFSSLFSFFLEPDSIEIRNEINEGGDTYINETRFFFFFFRMIGDGWYSYESDYSIFNYNIYDASPSLRFLLSLPTNLHIYLCWHS